MSEKSNIAQANLTPASYEFAFAMAAASVQKEGDFNLFEDVEQEHWAICFEPKNFLKIWKTIRAMIVLGHDVRVANVLFSSILSVMPQDFDKDVDLFGED